MRESVYEGKNIKDSAFPFFFGPHCKAVHFSLDIFLVSAVIVRLKIELIRYFQTSDVTFTSVRRRLREEVPEKNELLFEIERWGMIIKIRLIKIEISNNLLILLIN